MYTRSGYSERLGEVSRRVLLIVGYFFTERFADFVGGCVSVCVY